MKLDDLMWINTEMFFIQILHILLLLFGVGVVEFCVNGTYDKLTVIREQPTYCKWKE